MNGSIFLARRLARVARALVAVVFLVLAACTATDTLEIHCVNETNRPRGISVRTSERGGSTMPFAFDTFHQVAPPSPMELVGSVEVPVGGYVEFYVEALDGLYQGIHTAHSSDVKHRGPIPYIVTIHRDGVASVTSGIR